MSVVPLYTPKPNSKTPKEAGGGVSSEAILSTKEEEEAVVAELFDSILAEVPPSVLSC